MFRLPLFPVALALLLAACRGPDAALVFIGTFTEGRGNDGEGIYACRFDEASGRLTKIGLAAVTPNPSFLAFHPKLPVLYSVNAIQRFQGKVTGSVSAFAVDPQRGTLRLLGKASSAGLGPCDLIVDHRGRHLLVANYGAGNVAVLRLRPDGHPGAVLSVLAHRGKGADPRRQAAPHCHSVLLDPASRFAIVCDLGIDRVLTHRFDPETGQLTADTSVQLRPGSGPRRLAFHPAGYLAYGIHELDTTLTRYRYQPGIGRLEPVQTVRTVPQGAPPSTGAEVAVHPSGRFVYASNRGHDSIAVFAAAPHTGELTLVAHTAVGGRTPRHFTIDPSGRYLLAAAQGSHRVVVFRIHQESGVLLPTGNSVVVPSPVCVRFAPSFQESAPEKRDP